MTIDERQPARGAPSAQPTPELFSREEVLGSLPARRAQALLYQIERRTARLSETWSDMTLSFSMPPAPAPPGTPGGSDDLDPLLDAYRRERYNFPRPTLADLDRFASGWADLVPRNPRIRAAVALLLAQRFAFSKQDIPEIRTALRLDDADVQDAYQRLYRVPLETIYTATHQHAGHARRLLRAVSVRLESLPPTWLAGILLLALPLPTAFLALPIATATIGPLGGAALVLALGVVNLVTIAFLAESVGRSGPMRYGHAFLGRLTYDLLGAPGSILLTVALLLRVALALLAYYIGFSATLEHATGVPPAVWMTMLFAGVTAALVSGSARLLTSLMLPLSMASIGLLVILSILAVSHWRLDVALEGSLRETGSISAPSLGLLVGIALSCYTGHKQVVQVSRVVLQRGADPSALVRGGALGTATLALLLALWTVLMGGAIPSEMLKGHDGTVVEPLAEQVGLAAGLLGTLLVVLLLGIGTLRDAGTLASLTRERLPTRGAQIRVLPRRQGRLVLEPRQTSSTAWRHGLTYLGLDPDHGDPRVRIEIQAPDRLYRADITIHDTWDATALHGRFPELRHQDIQLRMDCLDATEDAIRLRVVSRLVTRFVTDGGGIELTDLVTGESDPPPLLRWVARSGTITAADAARHTDRDVVVMRGMLDDLVAQGLLVRADAEHQPRYRARFSPRRARSVGDPSWDEASPPPADRRTTRHSEHFLSPVRASLAPGGRLHEIAGLVPVGAIFLLALLLEALGTTSFATPLGFTGVVAVSVAGGIIPPMLFIAARGKGEIAVLAGLRLPGARLVAWGIWLLFVAVQFLHGFVIWDDPIQRLSAIAIGLAVIGITAAAIRGGTFAPRHVLEIRHETAAADRVTYSVMTAGTPTEATVTLSYRDREVERHGASGAIPDAASLRMVALRLPPGPARDLKVWVHRVTADGESTALPAIVKVIQGHDVWHIDLQLAGGQALVPVQGSGANVEVTLVDGAF